MFALSHVSIVVPDLDEAARRLREKYGLTVGEPILNAEQGVRLAYVELNGGRIELMQPLRPDSPVAKFLERHPRGGIHHFALAVEDVEVAAEQLGKNGVRRLGDGAPQYNVAGQKIAFLHPADFCGALVELEEHGSSARQD